MDRCGGQKTNLVHITGFFFFSSETKDHKIRETMHPLHNGIRFFFSKALFNKEPASFLKHGKHTKRHANSLDVINFTQGFLKVTK